MSSVLISVIDNIDYKQVESAIADLDEWREIKVMETGDMDIDDDDDLEYIAPEDLAEVENITTWVIDGEHMDVTLTPSESGTQVTFDRYFGDDVSDLIRRVEKLMDALGRETSGWIDSGDIPDDVDTVEDKIQYFNSLD